ncbi:unnamed protein product [Malus baccata var. baccata]
MTVSKASSVVALMAVLFAVLSAIGASQESPAPIPTSPAASISPSFVSTLVAIAVTALAFGSTLRVAPPRSRRLPSQPPPPHPSPPRSYPPSSPPPSPLWPSDLRSGWRLRGVSGSQPNISR